MNEEEFVTELLDRLRFIEESKKFPFIKHELSKISDTDVQRKANSLVETIFFADGTFEHKKRVVVLIHGIRTFAHWQERFQAEFCKFSNTTVYSFGYEYYDIFKFINPIKYSEVPISRIYRELKIVVDNHPNENISLVAHSFGTYVASKIITYYQDIKIDNLILCGCILPINFHWPKPIHATQVINEVGVQDMWPVMAKHINREYGASGTFGFKGAVAIDRFHRVKHDGFFTSNFIKKFWVPFVIYGQIVRTDWGKESDKHPCHIGLINNIFIYIKVVFWFLLIVVLLYGIKSLLNT